VETLDSRHFLSASIRALAICSARRIAAEEQPQRQFVEARDMNDDGRGFDGIAGLGRRYGRGCTLIGKSTQDSLIVFWSQLERRR
jgi:hypothetical protein